MIRPQPHQPNPQNEKFCLRCLEAIDGNERGSCSAEEDRMKVNEVMDEMIIIHLPDEVDDPSYTTAEVSGEIHWRDKTYLVQEFITLKLQKQNDGSVQKRIVACADCGAKIEENERHECPQMRRANRRRR